VLSARWRSRLSVGSFLLLLLGWGVMSVTLRPERKIPTFRIEFGDTAFVVEQDWVMPNERALNFSQYQVSVPRERVSDGVRALMLEDDLEVWGAEIPPRQTLKLDVAYSPGFKPSEQFSELNVANGWTQLPDTNPLFRVAVQEDGRPYATPRREAYEIKADPRLVIFCGVYPASERSKAWTSCTLKVPYKALCSTDKCTQIGFRLSSSQMSRWAEIADELRNVMRPLEVKRDPELWQKLQQIQRDGASWYQRNQSKPGKRE
jgi:hypothetical protein